MDAPDQRNAPTTRNQREPGHAPLRVAVIGSGLAGLSAAYLLRREGLEVFLLEKSEKLGFHSSSVEVPPSSKHGKGDNALRLENGAPLAPWIIDVPMRSFQGGYYPLLIALYLHLEIPLIPTFYTFSFSSFPSIPTDTSSTNPSREKDHSLGKTYFIYSGASGRSLPALPSIYLRDAYGVLLGILDFAAMAVCFILWSAIAFLAYHDLLPPPLTRATPLGELAKAVERRITRPLANGAIGSWIQLPFGGGIWKDFVGRVVIPIFSAVGTMTSQDVLRNPIGPLLDYAHTTIGTPHYTLAPGWTARSIAARLVAPIEAQGEGYVRLGEGVMGLRKSDGKILVETGKGEVEVDRVIIATQPTAARTLLHMLQGSLVREGDKAELRRVRGMQKALDSVTSRETIVVTHRDTSVLPPAPDLREINLHLPETPPAASSSKADSGSTPYFPPSPDSIYTMATHVISPPSHLQGSYETVLQTTNPVVPIDPSLILSTARLERALPLKSPAETLAALHPRRQPSAPPPSIYLVGSYAYPGIPLLEGCVGSAIHAVSDITGSTGDVDWEAGQGSRVGRLWRWRRRQITAF